MSDGLKTRFPGVLFYNAALTEVQDDVTIGNGSRIGSMTLLHQHAQIGEGTTIGSHCNICNCVIGNNVAVQTGCHITRGVVIEDDVFIGPHVVTLNDNFHSGALAYPYIEKNARIGGGSTILPGVRIGAGAVVGAGSVVAEDVAPGAVVFGTRAKPIEKGRPNKESS